MLLQFSDNGITISKVTVSPLEMMSVLTIYGPLTDEFLTSIPPLRPEFLTSIPPLA